ncbi:unnamed protein product [Dicrocoelium dendriticum]|nr:unnamed protein product [Dicrocoelium dendriticum]
MFPLRPRSSSMTVIFFIILIWLSALIVGLPGLIFGDLTLDGRNISDAISNETLTGNPIAMTVMVTSEKDRFKRQCYFNWQERFSAIYDYALFFLMYVLPLIILAATYVPISIRLWFHGEIGEVTRAQAESVRSKRRAVRMMCMVMLIFAVCWLPYQLFFIVLRIQPRYYQYAHLKFIFIFCYWLAMSNAVYNPIIYFTMNRRFRNGLFRLLPFLPRSKIIRRIHQRNRSKSTRLDAVHEFRDDRPTITEQERVDLEELNKQATSSVRIGGAIPYVGAK